MAFFQDRWDDRDVEKLIKLIQVHPCLWNSKSHDYKSVEARDLALVEISRKIGVPKEEIRKKYRNLRTQYIREMRHSKNRGYHRWTFFNSLKFLSEADDNSNGLWDPLNSDDTQEEIYPTQNSIDIDDDQYAEEFLDVTEGLDEEDVNGADFDQAEGVDVKYEAAEQPQFAKRSRYQSAYETKQNETNLTDNRSRKRPTVVVMKAPRKLRDEYTVFGEHVANELRILRNQKELQQTLKCTILQAILDINKSQPHLE